MGHSSDLAIEEKTNPPPGFAKYCDEVGIRNVESDRRWTKDEIRNLSFAGLSRMIEAYIPTFRMLECYGNAAKTMWRMHATFEESVELDSLVDLAERLYLEDARVDVFEGKISLDFKAW